jgi:hypothetical protein
MANLAVTKAARTAGTMTQRSTSKVIFSTSRNRPPVPVFSPRQGGRKIGIKPENLFLVFRQIFAGMQQTCIAYP